MAKTVASEFGALNILVNCAGYVHNGSILDCSDKDWDLRIGVLPQCEKILICAAAFDHVTLHDEGSPDL